MTFKEFIQVNLNIWNKYLNFLSLGITTGKIQLGTGKLLFPNIILFTQTADHFILELLGAKESFTSLKVKTHKIKSTFSYLYQFESKQEEPTIHLKGKDIGFKNLWISRIVDREALNKRYCFPEKWLTKLQFSEGSGALFSFDKEFESCFVDNCLIVNRFEQIYRVKYILHLIIVKREYTKKDYITELTIKFNRPLRTSNDLFGVHYCRDNQDEGHVLSEQFTNVFLLPGLRETTIGEFIKNNPIFIKRAFSCVDFLYEIELKWIEGNPDSNEKSIRPDLLLKRSDGYFDICDLKTALLFKQRITKGNYCRRRFIDYINEGISQLANYEEYFKFKKNQRFAFSHYNIKVLRPQLFLIIGSYENASREEIEQAARKLKQNYRIIDYDTLNVLFLKSFY